MKSVPPPLALPARNAFALIAPALATLAALLVHQYLPNQQDLPVDPNAIPKVWDHPYPLLLQAFLGAALLLALAPLIWRSLRPWALHNAPLIAGALFVVTLWDVATLKTNWMVLPFFPGPDMVLSGLVDDRAILLQCTVDSLLLLLSGYGAGVCAGLVTGVLVGWFPSVRYWVTPALRFLGPVPATTMVALVMTLSTKAFICGVLLIGFSVWFPMTMLTASGISNVRLSYLDVARTLGANRTYLIFRVALPAALPNIFIGLFIGLTVSFLTLPIAESVGVQAGLGWYVPWQKGYGEYAKVYAALGITAVFCTTIMTLLFKVRDRLLKWQKGVIKW